MEKEDIEKIEEEIKSIDLGKIIKKNHIKPVEDILAKKKLMLESIQKVTNTNKYNITINLEKLYKFSAILELNPFNQEYCSCGFVWSGKKKVCLHVAVILLAFNIGYFLQELEQEQEVKPKKLEQEAKSIDEVRTIVNSKLLEDLDIPPSIIDVLEELDHIIEIFLENGSQRISHTTLEWLNTLIIRTHTHKLIKIEQTLKKLQNVVMRYLEKSVIDNSVSFLSILTELHNYIQLTKHILNNTSHPYLTTVSILGQARSEYFPVNDITMSLLLGVSGWISETNMVGVTAYFLNLETIDNISESFFTGNNIRPIQNMPEGSPIMLYGFKTYSDITFKDLAKRSLYSLSNVKFNQNKNLSFHKELSINPLPFRFEEIKNTFLKQLIYSDWEVLLDKIQNKKLSPLEEKNFDMFFILEPSKYVSFDLDYITQKWKAPLIDKNGKILYLVVSNETAPHIANKIKNFQLMFKEDNLPNALFGKLDILEDEVVFNPISGWFYQGFRSKAKYGVTVNRISYNFDVDIGAEYIFT